MVNVPRIQITQHECSSIIPSENLTFRDIEINLRWYNQESRPIYLKFDANVVLMSGFEGIFNNLCRESPQMLLNLTLFTTVYLQCEEDLRFVYSYELQQQAWH